MTESVHGHDLLSMLVEAEGSLTRDGLARAVTERFGDAASFHTCSREGLSLEQILGIFLRKGRLREVDGRLEPSAGLREKLCEQDP